MIIISLHFTDNNSQHNALILDHAVNIIVPTIGLQELPDRFYIQRRFANLQRNLLIVKNVQ
jgi:hypothetical protein